MIKRNYDLIILAVLWIMSIYSIFTAIVDSYQIGVQNFVGYGLLVIITILRFIKIKKFRTILGVFLLIGSINAIQFTYYTTTFVFTWTPFWQSFSSFGLQPLSLILLIFFIITNFSACMRTLSYLFSDDKQESINKQTRIIEKYYNELKGEKDDKLQEIIDNKTTFQVEWVKAAQRVIDERKTNTNAL